MRFFLLLILLIFSFWIQSAKLHSVFLFTAVSDSPHVPCCQFFVHLQIIHYESYIAGLYLISKIQLCARCAYVCFILHISLWFQRVFNLIVVWIIRREMKNVFMHDYTQKILLFFFFRWRDRTAIIANTIYALKCLLCTLQQLFAYLIQLKCNFILKM